MKARNVLGMNRQIFFVERGGWDHHNELLDAQGGIPYPNSNLADGSNEILSKIDSGEGTIGKLLINDSLYDDTEKLVNNFNKVTERVANGTGPLGQLLSEDNKVIDDLQQAVNELNIALIKLNSTNSTIGKLLNDSELYDEGTKIIDDVRKSPLRFLIRNSEQWKSFYF